MSTSAFGAGRGNAAGPWSHSDSSSTGGAMLEPRRVIQATIVILTLFLLMSGLAFAQQTTFGRLAGTVLDASGGVLPGATVTATNEQTAKAVTAVTNERGAFLFPQLTSGSYKVTVELQGFRSAAFPGCVVNVAQEYSLTVKMEIGQMAETITVEGGTTLVQTTTPEVSKTVQQTQVLQLPLLNRDMTNLIRMQAGVQGSLNASRMNTGINGGKPSWTQVTQDGINIQDNFIRTNSVDFLPNRPTSDNVAEFTITSSVAGADNAGGASSVRMVTPSGSNQYHGSVFSTWRDAAWASRTYFDQRAGNQKPGLKRSQPGGRLGGPVMKNKLFFFGYYEGWRQKTAGVQNVTVPANEDTFKGVWRYVSTSDGQVRSVNLLELTGLTADQKMSSDVLSKIAGAANMNNTDRGDSKPGTKLNTGGYRYNQVDQNTRNYFGGRVDYEVNQNNHVEGIVTYFNELDDRPDLDFFTPANQRPFTYTSAPTKRIVGAWRWVVTPRLQNEVRGGMNLAPVRFESSYQYGAYRYAGQTGTLPLTLQDPEVNFLPQGRYTNTYQFNDSASFTRGNHAMQFGGSLQRIHVNPYNYEATIPTISWGFSSAAPANTTLKSTMFPGGISSGDLANAQTMLALVTGTIQGATRTFQVQDATSGYVDTAYSNRNFTLNNIAIYAQDSWRWKSNLTLRYGLKWEYYSPLSEDNNLGLYPVLTGSLEQTLLNPTFTVSQVNGGLYSADRNNFGPTVGMAWDPFKDGKTSVRAGYSLTFVNEETVTVGQNFMNMNAGMSAAASVSSLYTNLSAGVPTIPTPVFKTTRTAADQMALSATGTVGMIDPNITQPRVHQVSIGVQRELLWGFTGEARYVGTFGKDIWKGVDYNQINLSSAFLTDFNQARYNYYTSLAETGSGNPASATCTGCKPLTVLPLYGGGFLTSSTVLTSLRQNEAANLADFYVVSRSGGQPIKNSATGNTALAEFYPNGGIYQAGAMINDGWQTYNALQLEVQRRFKNGIFGSMNYTWAHTRSNGGLNGQNRFEPYLDNNRKYLDEGRSAWNINHNIKGNFIAELPFGDSKKFLSGKGPVVNGIVGGWQVSGIVNWQTGAPLGIYSARGTFNRTAWTTGVGGRAGYNTALTDLTPEQIQSQLKVYYTSDGRLLFVPASWIGTDGRAVGSDNLANSAGFAGQQFLNPTAGNVGDLKIIPFDGPSALQIDLALTKRVMFAKKYAVEFRAEAFNLTNGVYFFMGDMNINNSTFGRITAVAVPSRVVQLSARFQF
jgi:hypothetical protein